MAHVHHQPIPKAAIVGAGALILFTIAIAGGARLAHSAAPPTVAAPALRSMLIRFEDRPNGTLAILDATTGRDASVLPGGSNGFVRGVLRGMFRERKLESMDHDAQFVLAREASGRLSLTDPETGRRVDLDSFGPTNSEAFAQLFSQATQATQAKQ